MAATTANPFPFLSNTVDLSTLSNSELHSLSLLSTPAGFSPLPSLDAATVQINSSFFNESSSTRQQTFSSTPHHHRHHRHATTTSTVFSEDDRAENVSIVGFLKRYLRSNAEMRDCVITKRKRKRKVDGIASAQLEIVNRNGVVVDLAALEEVEDDERENEFGGGGPFAEELRKRAAGREKEEELLEVLAEMKGRWCSRRMKRRVVDASLLGDSLPVGWEVIIALRRKDGRFSPYCRHYISPTGEQFSSCKEVSSYLKSHFGINDPELLRDSGDGSRQLQILDVDNRQCFNSKDDHSLLDVSNLSVSNTCLPVAHDKDISVSGIDNLPDVQVCDLYECGTCNLTFDVKDNYLRHLLSTHKKTTKRYRLNSSVGNEMIVENGDYKCDTCNIRFDGKDKYLQHNLSTHKKGTKKRKLGPSVGNEMIVKNGNYECGTCNIMFDGKDKYLQHNLSTHKKGTKRRKLGPSVADGVIIRDGKYECQFCHKVFEERRRYLGHVGNHIKGSISTPKELLLQAGLPYTDQLKTKTGNSKLNALIVVAQSSIQDGVPSALEKGPSSVDNFSHFGVAEINKTQNDKFVAENCGGEAKALTSLLSPCSQVSRTFSACPTDTETVKDKGRSKTMSHSNVVSEMSMIDDINVSVPCLDELELERNNALADISSMELYSCDTMKKASIDDENICEESIQLSEINKPDKQTNKQAVTSKMMNCEKGTCFDTKMMQRGETCILADISNGNWEIKSTTTDDEEPTDESGGYGIRFVSYNQKPSMDAAGDIVQSKYMDKHALEHVQGDDDSKFASVASDNNAFGCTAAQTFLNSSPFDEIFEKAEQNICNLDPNLENGSAFEYMKLDTIEPQMYKYNAMSGEDSMFLPEVSMELEKDTGFDLGFNASAKAESELPGEIGCKSRTTMFCVWCGLEFCHEGGEIELQPDSVGFMCPTCRTKISKQFNELENSFSVDPHYP